MQSSGGTIPARLAAEEPVRTMLSGPAGGVMGAYQMARLAGFDRIIGFDMGGTSTDVCLVDAERAVLNSPPRPLSRMCPSASPCWISIPPGRAAAHWPASMPAVCCAWAGIRRGFSRTHLLWPRRTGNRNGCESDPRPAGLEEFSRRRGKPRPERALAYMEKARGSIASVEEFAAGILRLVETSMEKAIRVISVERGYDPRDFTLVAFGGGGPLHACSLAHALRIPRVLVPALPGALSAVGILLADAVRDYSRTVMLAADADLENVFAELEERGRSEFAAEQLAGFALRSLDLRYQGQGYELNVPSAPMFLTAFHDLHRLRYGFAKEEHEVEVVNVRVRMVAASEPFNPAESR
jgi:N-methylhydantoinase A